MSNLNDTPISNDKGFNLVEVLASLVIIAIVLISFSQIFISNNKVAAKNNDKLITINLAEAELERLKITPFVNNLIPKPTSQPLTTNTISTSKNHVNDHSTTSTYELKITYSQTQSEYKKKLINVEISVTYRGSTVKTEGYLSYED